MNMWIIAGMMLMFSCLGGWYIHQQRRYHQKLKTRLEEMEQLVKQIKRDHPALIQADLHFANQIQDVTAQLVSMDNQIQSLLNKRDNDGGYQHALHILQMGGSKEEIMNSCHLSNAEAELLMNLNAYRSAIHVSN